MSQLEFSWELRGSGWATCRIADGAREQKDFVSYCTDALADVLHGVAGLYGHLSVQRFSFDLEPAEVRWVLRRTSSDVHVAIYRFPDMSTSFDVPDQAGTLSWTSTQPSASSGTSSWRRLSRCSGSTGRTAIGRSGCGTHFPSLLCRTSVVCICSMTDANVSTV